VDELGPDAEVSSSGSDNDDLAFERPRAEVPRREPASASSRLFHDFGMRQFLAQSMPIGATPTQSPQDRDEPAPPPRSSWSPPSHNPAFNGLTSNPASYAAALAQPADYARRMSAANGAIFSSGCGESRREQAPDVVAEQHVAELRSRAIKTGHHVDRTRYGLAVLRQRLVHPGIDLDDAMQESASRPLPSSIWSDWITSV
jgi:hypothetical protein